MMDHIKIKHFFSPLAIVIISAIAAAILSRIPTQSNYGDIILVIFDSLFLYWFVALIFNVRGFIKNRIVVNKD